MGKQINEQRTQSFMGNVAIVLFAQLMVKILGMVYRMVITNISGFGDSGNGFYTAGFQVYTVLLAVSSIGIPNAIAKMVSERVALNDYMGAHRVFHSALILFSVIGAVFSGLLFFGADVVAQSIVNMDGVQYVMRALSPSIFFVCVSSVIRGYFQGLNDMRATSLSQMLEQVFKCGLTIVLVLLSAGTMPVLMQFATKTSMLYSGSLAKNTPPEIMAAWANAASSIATLISFVYLIVFYYRQKSQLSQKLRQSVASEQNPSTASLMKAILMLSIPISLASIITAINRVIDTATITRGIEIAFANGIPAHGNVGAILHPTLKDLNEYAVLLAGRLSKSDTLINMPLALNVAFATVLVPSVSGALARGEKKEAGGKISYSFLISTLLILPCVAGFIVLAEPIYKVIYPNAYLGSDLLALMAISLIFSALSQTMSGALQGLGKVYVPAIGLVIGCVIKVILNVLLIRQTAINIYGAAISSIICQFVAFLISFIVLQKYLTLNLTIKKYVIKPAVACVVMGAVAFGVYKVLDTLLPGGYITNAVATISGIGIGAVAYLIMIVVLKVLDEDEILELPLGHRILNILKKMKIYR